MIYGSWVMVIGKCLLGVCLTQEVDLERDTYSNQQSCEMAGILIKQIGEQRVIWPTKIDYKCYDLLPEIEKRLQENQRKRLKVPKPAKPATL